MAFGSKKQISKGHREHIICVFRDCVRRQEEEGRDMENPLASSLFLCVCVSISFSLFLCVLSEKERMQKQGLTIRMVRIALGVPVTRSACRGPLCGPNIPSVFRRDG